MIAEAIKFRHITSWKILKMNFVFPVSEPMPGLFCCYYQPPPTAGDCRHLILSVMFDTWTNFKPMLQVNQGMSMATLSLVQSLGEKGKKNVIVNSL